MRRRPDSGTAGMSGCLLTCNIRILPSNNQKTKITTRMGETKPRRETRRRKTNKRIRKVTKRFLLLGGPFQSY